MDNAELNTEGSLRLSASPADLDLQLSLISPDAAVISALLGISSADLPGYQVHTQLDRKDNAWRLRNLNALLGRSELTGQVTVKPTAPEPFLKAGLVADTLYMSQIMTIYHTLFSGPKKAENGDSDLSSVSKKPGNEEQTERGNKPISDISKNVKSLLNQLQPWTADIDLQASEIVTPELSINDFSLQLNLAENGQLKVNPIRLDINSSEATLNLALDLSRWPISGSVKSQFKPLNLSHLSEAFGATKAWPGTLSGNISLLLADTDKPKEDGEVILPFVGQLTIEPSELNYTDHATKTAIKTTIASEIMRNGQPTVRIKGSGRYRDEPFELNFKGDSLLQLRDKDKPYGINLTLAAAETHIGVEGTVLNIVAPTFTNVTLSVRGPNPARLYPLVGIALPELPPYQFTGDLTYQQNALWQISNINGLVGDSDIHGEIQLDLNEKQPALMADLHSNLLDFDDLAGLVGAAPDSGPGETASPEQQREGKKEARSQSVLPDDLINTERLRAINASVDFKGKRVQVDKLPLDSLTLKMELEDGEMNINPLKFSVGDGTVNSTIELSADKQPIRGNLATEIRQVNLNKVMEPIDIRQDSAGIIGGRAKYWMRGNSVAELLASANGGLYLLMTDGHLDGLLTEVAGFDWGEAMMAFFANRRNVDIRCAYLNLHSNNGLTELKNAIIDTDDTVFAMTGSVDMRQETLDLVLEPHPKDISLFSTRVPLHIDGTFKDPGIAPGAAALASKTAFAALLTAAAGPIGTLLPFIEPGLTDDSNFCNGLIDSVNPL